MSDRSEHRRISEMMAANREAFLEAQKAISLGYYQEFRKTPTKEPKNMTKPEVTPAPCPLCECSAIQWVSGGPGCHYLRCEGCGLSTDDGSRERILARWNNRPAIQAAEQRRVKRERKKAEKVDD